LLKFVVENIDETDEFLKNYIKNSSASSKNNNKRKNANVRYTQYDY